MEHYEQKIEMDRRHFEDADGTQHGEISFSVTPENLQKAIRALYPENTSLDEFLKKYTPEIDGERIYEYLKERDGIAEDIGVRMYDPEEGISELDEKTRQLFHIHAYLDFLYDAMTDCEENKIPMPKNLSDDIEMAEKAMRALDEELDELKGEEDYGK